MQFVAPAGSTPCLSIAANVNYTAPAAFDVTSKAHVDTMVGTVRVFVEGIYATRGNMMS